MVSRVSRRVIFPSSGDNAIPRKRIETSVKVMVAFGPQTFTLLDTEAKQRGISVQELLRAVIIPEWFKTHGDVSFKNSGPVFKNKYGEPRENVVPSPVGHP